MHFKDTYSLWFIGRKISAQNIVENINVTTVSMQSVLLKHQGKSNKGTFQVQEQIKMGKLSLLRL